ncbi:MAG: exodeoxyribonuclease VII large subunit [Candidatus Aminicenantes bacterium]|nr:exodeoxyribonuclease VII large subunit [Candidatus Aminicenantes bacterium]
MRNNNSFQPEKKIYTVSEITSLIKKKLESQFPLVWVEGEVSNFHRHHSGHLYFTLKDEKCQLRAVMFRSTAQRIPFDLKDGLKVVCKGGINVYEPRGEYQIIVEEVEPKGIGALQLAFEQLKEKLKAEGLFNPEFKKKLPMLPKKVGVVTSPRGAAIIDILRTLERRFARVHIVIYPAKVQGEGASDEIVEGIEYLAQIPDMDVIIIGRGGGSIEDLWAFNEEKVARAIFRSPVPIISAVGHEIDFTIADFVADIRASTPSAAAEIVIEKEQSFSDRIENLEKRISYRLNYMLQEQKHKVLNLVRHKAFQDFKVKLLNLEQRVDELEMRARVVIQRLQQKIAADKSRAILYEQKIIHMVRAYIQYLQGKWERFSTGLHSLSPLNVLKKGYTLCWKNGDQHLVRTIKEVNKDEEVIVSFYKGEMTCLVKEIDGDISIESRFIKEKT